MMYFMNLRIGIKVLSITVMFAVLIFRENLISTAQLRATLATVGQKLHRNKNQVSL